MSVGRRVLLVFAIPLLVVVVLIAAWAIDTSQASGKVPRNVTLAGEDIGRLSEDRLAARVQDIAEEYEGTKVQVKVGAETYEAPAALLGLRLDENATINSALDLDADTSLITRPVTWLGSFASERDAPLHFTVDDTDLENGLRGLFGTSAVEAVEPKVVMTDTGLNIVSGTTGRTIDPEGVKEQLIARASSGETPIVVRTGLIEQEPTISDDAARAFASDINAKTANGLAVTAGSKTINVRPATVRSWLSAKQVDGGFDLTLDGKRAMNDLRAAMPVATPIKNAAITLVNNQVQITPSSTGVACCADDSPARLLDAVEKGSGAVTLEMRRREPEFTTEDAEKLGIKEPVGTITEWKGQPQVKSFTTYYGCCEARVTNIHRIADAVRGTIVKPGETFSLNERVGQRTTAKGYVEAGVIYNGVHETDVGGGTSQFSTTLFNAAFFGGMNFEEYQSHTIHFDRYPYGREATLGWEHPDQKWLNDTPYGVMIWTSYTDTSVTVTLWSTQNVYGQQTGQTTEKVGACTRVRTQRTRTWADGRNEVDYVGSLYRPAEGVDCPGL